MLIGFFSFQINLILTSFYFTYLWSYCSNIIFLLTLDKQLWLYKNPLQTSEFCQQINFKILCAWLTNFSKFRCTLENTTPSWITKELEIAVHCCMYSRPRKCIFQGVPLLNELCLFFGDSNSKKPPKSTNIRFLLMKKLENMEPQSKNRQRNHRE